MKRNFAKMMQDERAEDTAWYFLMHLRDLVTVTRVALDNVVPDNAEHVASAAASVLEIVDVLAERADEGCDILARGVKCGIWLAPRKDEGA